MAVAELKREPTGDLFIAGSRELIQTLMRHNLIDEYLLFIQPVALCWPPAVRKGSPNAALGLIDSTTTTTGVLIVTYEAGS